MILILATVFAGLTGLAFGSFLNVCLSRWPEGESIVSPRSHCRACRRTLAWWENVPVLSWVGLRGRCRTCKAAISWRYPLVEFAVGTLWAYIVWQRITEVTSAWAHLPPGYSVSFSPLSLAQFFEAIVSKMLLIWLLIALAVLDKDHLWLPNWLIYPGIAFALGYAFLRTSTTQVSWATTSMRSFMSALLSAMIAAGLILLIRWIYWLVRRREGIGLGDAKLMAMLGAWLGLPGALLAFAIGVVLGAVAALVILMVPAWRALSPRSRNQGPGAPNSEALEGSDRWAMIKLPLGTFLCIGGIVSALWGQPIIAAYLRWAGLS